MNQPKHPSKEQVRQYLAMRQQAHSPPPSINEIRRQLGWDLVDMTRASHFQTSDASRTLLSQYKPDDSGPAS